MKLPFVFVAARDNVALAYCAGSVDAAFMLAECLINLFDALGLDPLGLSLVAIGTDDSGHAPFMFPLDRLDSICTRHTRWSWPGRR